MKPITLRLTHKRVKLQLFGYYSPEELPCRRNDGHTIGSPGVPPELDIERVVAIGRNPDIKGILDSGVVEEITKEALLKIAKCHRESRAERDIADYEYERGGLNG